MGLVGRVAADRKRRTLVQQEMFQSIMDMLESHDRVRREEHEAFMTKLE